MPEIAVAPPPATQAPPVQATFLRQALARIKANLELLLGKIAITAAEPVSMPTLELQARLASPCLVVGLAASGKVDMRTFCLVPEPLAVAMSLLAQLKPKAAVAERLAGTAQIEEAERDWVKEVASFILAALGDFAKDALRGRVVVAPMETRFLPDDGPPIEVHEDGWLAIDGEVVLDDVSPMTITLVAPAVLAQAIAEDDVKPSVFVAEPAPSRPEALREAGAQTNPEPLQAAAGTTPPAAWSCGRAPFSTAVRSAFGDAAAVRAFGGLHEILAAARAGAAPPVVVIEVSRGAEFQLDLIAALWRHPALATARVVVALEDATRRNVLRCGALGLLDVVPQGVPASVLAQRLAGRSRGAQAGKAR